jgi:hypothetical protein
MTHALTRWRSWLLLAGPLATLGCVESEAESLCEPGQNVFCRCPDQSASTRTCQPDGNGFDACRCDGSDDDPTWVPPPADEPPGSYGPATSSSTGAGPSANGEGGGGSDPDGAGASGVGAGAAGPTGGASAGKLLLAACSSDPQCESGMCRDGYCTKSCTRVADCKLPYAECVARPAGASLCMARCEGASSCSQYGPTSKCGFAYALDNWRVAVCARWDTAHALPPAGSDCTPLQHRSCNLGYAQTERVCSTGGQCVEGCAAQADCRSGTSCSAASAQQIGTCR